MKSVNNLYEPALGSWITSLKDIPEALVLMMQGESIDLKSLHRALVAVLWSQVHNYYIQNLQLTPMN